MKLNIKQIRKHRKNCFAIQAVKTKEWHNPWAYIDNAIWIHNMRWVEIKCNDPRCKAKIIVQEEGLLNLLPKDTPNE